MVDIGPWWPVVKVRFAIVSDISYMWPNVIFCSRDLLYFIYIHTIHILFIQYCTNRCISRRKVLYFKSKRDTACVQYKRTFKVYKKIQNPEILVTFSTFGITIRANESSEFKMLESINIGSIDKKLTNLKIISILRINN